MIGAVFLRAISDHDFCIRWGLIFRDVGDLSGIHDEHSVCSDGVRFIVALAHAAKILSECGHPDVRCDRVIH